MDWTLTGWSGNSTAARHTASGVTNVRRYRTWPSGSFIFQSCRPQAALMPPILRWVQLLGHPTIAITADVYGHLVGTEINSSKVIR
jgi:hypothetical protein